MRNITGKTKPTAAVEGVSICPTKKVSAILYRLVTSIEKMLGTAIVRMTFETGP
jgi:hypothetical protein